MIYAMRMHDSANAPRRFIYLTLYLRTHDPISIRDLVGALNATRAYA